MDSLAHRTSRRYFAQFSSTSLPRHALRERRPIVILIEDRGQGGILAKMAASTLRENRIEFITTSDIVSPNDNSNFVSDGHFTPAANEKIARAVLSLFQAGQAILVDCHARRIRTETTLTRDSAQIIRRHTPSGDAVGNVEKAKFGQQHFTCSLCRVFNSCDVNVFNRRPHEAFGTDIKFRE